MTSRYGIVEALDDKAEGRCLGLPYTTELVNINGVRIHFWCGAEFDEELISRAITVARSERDIVAVSCSLGEPSGFWAHEDLPRQRDS